MKHLLVLTDFSAHATHAAEYAYAFSKKIDTDMTLCNAVLIPVEEPQAGLVVWPMQAALVLREGSRSGLEQLEQHLKTKDQTHDRKPRIEILSKSGYLQDVVKRVVATQPIDFVSMGTHRGDLGSFFFGNHARNMISSLNVPLLLIPEKIHISLFKKIYLASDFSDLQGDSVVLRQLIPLAKAFKAEIFIAHIARSENGANDRLEKVKLMLLASCCDLNFSKIHFIGIYEEDEILGLDKLMAQASMELLVMIHRNKGFLNGLFHSSITQKLAKQLDFPMLIFKALPEAQHIA
ncbi:nucleotide-binding universal stress UspA family protein [Pedobacter sp. UYEF25]